MVHDRVPRVLYEHPIIEYIPLAVVTLATGPSPAAPESGAPGCRPTLLALPDRESWESAASRFAYAFPSGETLGARLGPPDQPLSKRRLLPLLAIGFTAAAGIYRGRKVSLVTASVGPVYHLFALPLKYFYKPLIDFVAYTAFGAPLAQAQAVDVGRRPAPPDG